MPFAIPKSPGPLKPSVILPRGDGTPSGPKNRTTTTVSPGPIGLAKGQTKNPTSFADPKELIRSVLAATTGSQIEMLPLDLMRLAVETTASFSRVSSALRSSEGQALTESVQQNLNRLVETLDRGQKLLDFHSRLSPEDRKEYIQYLANSIPTLDSHQTQNPSQLASTSVARFLEVLPSIFTEGLLPEVRSLLSLVKTTEDFTTFAQVAEQLLRLSPSERGQVLLTLRQARQTGQTISNSIAQAIIREVGRGDEVLHEASQDSPQSNLIVHDVYLSGSVPEALVTRQNEAKTNVPLSESSAIFKFYPLQKSMTILSQTLGPQAAAVFGKIFSGDGRVTLVDIQAIQTFVNLLKSGETNVTEKIIPQLILAWIHRKEAVRARVLEIFKAIAAEDKKTFLNQNGLAALKIMARDRRSLELQAEAIQLALDLFGGEEGRSHDEWKQFLQEVEIVPTLRRLLRSPEDSEVQMGLDLFRKTWSLVGAAGKERLVSLVLHLAQEHPSDEIAEEAMGLLFVHKGELTRPQMISLLENYEGLLRASHEEYRNGGAHYIGIAAQKIEESKAQQSSGVYRYSN